MGFEGQKISVRIIETPWYLHNTQAQQASFSQLPTEEP